MFWYFRKEKLGWRKKTQEATSRDFGSSICERSEAKTYICNQKTRKYNVDVLSFTCALHIFYVPPPWHPFLVVYCKWNYVFLFQKNAPENVITAYRKTGSAHFSIITHVIIVSLHYKILTDCNRACDYSISPNKNKYPNIHFIFLNIVLLYLCTKQSKKGKICYHF